MKSFVVFLACILVGAPSFARVDILLKCETPEIYKLTVSQEGDDVLIESTYLAKGSNQDPALAMTESGRWFKLKNVSARVEENQLIIQSNDDLSLQVSVVANPTSTVSPQWDELFADRYKIINISSTSGNLERTLLSHLEMTYLGSKFLTTNCVWEK